MGNSEDSKRTDLSDIHAVQLEMMKTLAAVFEKNGLRYALYCGTLLGAIRHRGFIPWDDDVDLVMPLEDYRRFLRLAAKELPRGYVVLTPENSDTHIIPWAKVFLDGTTMMSKSQAAYDTHWGVYIDIYPMIGECPVRVLRKMQTIAIRFVKLLLSPGVGFVFSLVVLHTPLYMQTTYIFCHFTGEFGRYRKKYRLKQKNMPAETKKCVG